MNHIICVFRPFTMNQNVMVYINGECVKTVSVDVDRIIDVVNGFKNQYNIDKIELCGNQSYLSKFQAEMNSKFGNSCEINVIKR